MERRVSLSEKAAVAAGSTLLLFALASCNGAVAINEHTIWYGSERMRSDPSVVEHETCHQDQMKEVGGADIFWKKYHNDPVFRCQAELECGGSEEHFACSDFSFTIPDTTGNSHEED